MPLSANIVVRSVGPLLVPSSHKNTVTLSGAAGVGDISSAINSLIGGAPSTLNTLGKIAASIANNATYANTVTDALALKASITYVDNAIANIDFSSYATKVYVDNAVANIDFSSYATEVYVDNAIANLDINSYATEVYVDNAVANVDLSPYATKTYVDSKQTLISSSNTFWYAGWNATTFEFRMNNTLYADISDSGYSLAVGNFRFQPSSHIHFANSSQIYWSSTSSPGGTKDLGLSRSDARLLKITDGSTGLGDTWSRTAFIGDVSNTENIILYATSGKAWIDSTNFDYDTMYTLGHEALSYEWYTGDSDWSNFSKKLELASNGQVIFGSSGDVGLERSGVNTLKVTNASTGYGYLYAGRVASNDFRDFLNQLGITPGKLSVYNSGEILWSSTTAYTGTPDTGLSRYEAGTIKATNGSTGEGSFAGSEFRTIGGNQIRISRTFGINLPSSLQVNWSNNTSNGLSSKDVGLARDSAGVLRVSDGSTGNGDLIVDSISTQGSSGVSINIAAASAIRTGIVDSSVYLDLGTAVFRNGNGSNSGGAIRLFGDFKIEGTSGEKNWKFSQNGVIASSDMPFNWSSTTGSGATDGFDGTADIGIKRRAAGVLQITNGSTGYGWLDAALFQINSGFSMAIAPSSAEFNSTYHLVWSENANAAGTKDIGITRDSAGVLRISDGSTGVGLLIVDTPTSNSHAATKQYVDDTVANLNISSYATEIYVDNAISALANSAPAALDTLNELAAALGDDANFSTTVTNSLAGKLSLTGGTMTGKLITRVSNTASAGFNLGGTGVGPSSPVAGDMWTTGSTLNVRLSTNTRTVSLLEATESISGTKTFTAGTTTFSSSTGQVVLSGASGLLSFSGANAAIRFASATSQGPATPANGHFWISNSQGKIRAHIAGATANVSVEGHTHAISNVTGLQTALDGKLSLTGGTVTGNTNFRDYFKAEPADLSGFSGAANTLSSAAKFVFINDANSAAYSLGAVAQNSGTGTYMITDINSAYTQSYTYGSVYSVDIDDKALSTAYVHYSTLRTKNTSGAITTGGSVYSASIVNSGDSDITQVRAFEVRPPYNSGNGAISLVYDFYSDVDHPTGPQVTRRGVWINHPGNNYMAGNLLVDGDFTGSSNSTFRGAIKARPVDISGFSSSATFINDYSKFVFINDANSALISYGIAAQDAQFGIYNVNDITPNYTETAVYGSSYALNLADKEVSAAYAFSVSIAASGANGGISAGSSVFEGAVSNSGNTDIVMARVFNARPPYKSGGGNINLVYDFYSTQNSGGGHDANTRYGVYITHAGPNYMGGTLQVVGTVEANTPTSNSHLTTKEYVDTLVANSAASVTVANSTPGSPANGDLWWNSEDGNLYIYYTDADTSQWVSATYAAQGDFSWTGDKASNTNIYSGDTNKLLTTDNIYEAFATPTVLSIANSSIDIDCSTGFDFSLTLDEDATMELPTNGKPGTAYRVRILQDFNGGSAKTLSFASGYEFPAGNWSGVSTSNGAYDVIYMHCRDSSHFEVTIAADMKAVV